MLGLGNFHLILQDSEMCGVLSPNLALPMALQPRSLAPERDRCHQHLWEGTSLWEAAIPYKSNLAGFASPHQFFPVDCLWVLPRASVSSAVTFSIPTTFLRFSTDVSIITVLDEEGCSHKSCSEAWNHRHVIAFGSQINSRPLSSPMSFQEPALLCLH